MTANGHSVNLEVGEGSPSITWEVGSHYTQQPDGTTTGGDIFDGMPSQTSTATPVSFNFYIYNVSSSTVYKMFTGNFVQKTTSGFNTGNISAYWNSDTNPLTGVEVVANGGTTIASGTCSLYGMN